MKKFYSIFLVLFLVAVTLSAQPFTGNVLYLTTAAQLSGADDAFIVAKLTSWGFTVTISDIASFKASAPSPTNAELSQYKFAFVSEYCGSGDGARFRGATGTTWTGGWLNIPIITTDNWFTKLATFGFLSSSSQSATTYANVSLTGYTPASGCINGSGKVKIVDQSSHTLSGGLAYGTEITLATATTEANGAIVNFAIPTITPIIPIAALSEDATGAQLVAYGVEKGTATYNSAGTKDGTLLTKARIAAIGIIGQALGTVTTDGFKLILGAVKWVMDPAADVKETEMLPTQYSLNQNYPNPFNPSTVISYQLPAASFVTLKVYDVLGNEVATLVNELQQAGTHTSTFNTQNLQLSSGIYFYKIQTNNFVQTKKMILIK
jgi:hypothetical protein